VKKCVFLHKIQHYKTIGRMILSESRTSSRVASCHRSTAAAKAHDDARSVRKPQASERAVTSPAADER
jgi:hypothetical protein